jgi:hypothetical protein
MFTFRETNLEKRKRYATFCFEVARSGKSFASEHQSFAKTFAAPTFSEKVIAVFLQFAKSRYDAPCESNAPAIIVRVGAAPDSTARERASRTGL